MEDERNPQYPQAGESQEKSADQVEVKDRGFIDTILGRKKPEEQEKKEEEALAAGMENVKVSEEPAKHEDKKEEEHHGGEKKESLLAKLHRTSSSSSSSSEEEEEVIDDNGEVVKRKKKKGLKEKIKEKLPGGHKEPGAEAGEHKPHVPAPAPPAAPVETHAHKVDDDHKAYIPATAPATTTGTTAHVHQDDNAVVVQKVEETPEKGLMEKIKEKLPGGHKKPEDATAVAAPPAEDVSSPDGKEKKQGLLGKIMDKIPGYHKSPAEEEHKPTTAADEHKTSS